MRLRALRDSKLGPVPFDVAAALLVLYVVWGSTYLAIRFAVAELPPYLMLAARFGVAGGLLYAFMRARGARNPTARQTLGSAAVGVLLLVGGMGSVGLAQSFGAPSGLAAVMVATMPLWLTLILTLGGERSRATDWLGLGVGLLGVLLLNLGSDLRSNPLAALLLFVSPFSWALGSALSRRMPQAPGGMGSAVQMLTAGLLFVPLGLLRGESVAGAPSLGPVLALAYLVVFGSLIGFSAYVYLLNQRVRPALLTSYAYVNPVVAVLLGAAFAGERIAPLGLVGMAVVVLSVLLVLRPGGRR
ncbi:MAG: drug/metabolite exporter YedA [Deinococcales bacterium]|mgnify:FL=1|nr:drug/metabolite exporter YedA [Deinococcales bacterium]